MTSTRSALLIVIVCLIVACCAALMFFGGSGAADRSRAGSSGEATASAISPALGATDDHLARELLAEIRGLRADLLERTGASTAREPAAKGSGDSDLLAAVKDLSAALRERAGVAAAGGVARVNTMQPASSTGLANLESLLNSKDPSQYRQHYFLTLQQVLDRYGMPTSMNVREGVLEMNYYIGPEGKQRFCAFQIFDGLVIGMSSN